MAADVNLEQRYRRCEQVVSAFAKAQAEEVDEHLKKCQTKYQLCESRVNALVVQRTRVIANLSLSEKELDSWKKTSKWETAGSAALSGLVLGFIVGKIS